MITFGRTRKPCNSCLNLKKIKLGGIWGFDKNGIPLYEYYFYCLIYKDIVDRFDCTCECYRKRKTKGKIKRRYN